MSNIFSRIIVGVDDSEASKQAVEFAARLAREHDGDLILCHSVDWLPVITGMVSSGAVVDTEPIVEDLREDGKEELDRAARSALKYGVVAECRAAEGEPAGRLLEAANEAQCSLIVMGTHGRQGLDRLFVGSTTEAVLRGSTIPVLTLRSGAKQADATRRCFERIAVGIDDSEPSDAAVQTVLALPTDDCREVFFYSVAGTGGAEGEKAERVVAKAIAAAHSRGVSAKGQVVEGHTEDALIAFAQQRFADLIVVGSHGRRGLQRAFIGSVAEHVVRKAPLPVMVVRTHASIPEAILRSADPVPASA